jgi:hypothetical protein
LSGRNKIKKLTALPKTEAGISLKAIKVILSRVLLDSGLLIVLFPKYSNLKAGSVK